MKEKLGLVINRLVIGFTFAFIYQIVIGVATSILSLPLTGNVQDLVAGIEQIDSGHGAWFIAWWVLSTAIITFLALLIVKNKRYLSPYKGEKNIDIPPRITPITAIMVGGIISFLFFLLDLVIGSTVRIENATDVQAIYQAAVMGNLVPLGISIVFSIAAGFIIVGVASKTSKLSEIANEFTVGGEFASLSKIFNKKKSERTTIEDTIGLRPGELIHVGEKRVEKIRVDLIEYDAESFNEIKDTSIETCLDSKNRTNTSWINIIGIHDPTVIEKLGTSFDLHTLYQANIMNTELRPSIEITDDHIFLMLKMPHFNEEKGKVDLEQISIVIAKNHVLTFQEFEKDFFEQIRKRIRENTGTIRKLGTDYLAYSLLDAIIDSYFVVLERISDVSENLEEELMKNPSQDTLHVLQMLKRQMILLRKSMWPAREVIDSLQRSHTPLIHDETKTYFKDTYNHVVQAIDTIEGLRDVVGGLLDTYLSSVSNKMNEVMKTLTIIASIFIPITFLAGIYGTNFSYIPELEWEGSYFAMIGAMTIIVIVMILWFKKRAWL